MAEINIPTGPITTEPWDAIRTEPGESLTAACRTTLIRELGGMEFGDWDDELLGWLAGQDPSVVATVCSWLRRVRGLPAPASPSVCPESVAGVLREAARVMRVQAPTVLGVAATIRLAAGGGPAGHVRAEEALEFARDHVEPGVRVADLEQWRSRRTCLQVAEALELAADAAEQGGAQ